MSRIEKSLDKLPKFPKSLTETEITQTSLHRWQRRLALEVTEWTHTNETCWNILEKLFEEFGENRFDLWPGCDSWTGRLRSETHCGNFGSNSCSYPLTSFTGYHFISNPLFWIRSGSWCWPVMFHQRVQCLSLSLADQTTLVYSWFVCLVGFNLFDDGEWRRAHIWTWFLFSKKNWAEIMDWKEVWVWLFPPETRFILTFMSFLTEV